MFQATRRLSCDRELRIDAGLPEFRSCSTQRGADAVNRDANVRANLTVASALEMKKAYHLGFMLIEALEQPLDLFAILNPLLDTVFSSRIGNSRERDIQRIVFYQFAHDDTAGNDREVSGQTTLAAKCSQDRKVVLQDFEKHVSAKIFAILVHQADRSSARGVIHNVHHQSQKTIHERFPGPWLVCQALFEQAAINLG